MRRLCVTYQILFVGFSDNGWSCGKVVGFIEEMNENNQRLLSPGADKKRDREQERTGTIIIIFSGYIQLRDRVKGEL